MAAPILWSIHDVAPDTIGLAHRILNGLARHNIKNVTLLVIPDLRSWTAHSLAMLKSLEDEGYVLAAHGWTHNNEPPRSIYHKVHSTLFSRNAAEHLDKTSAEIVEIMRRSRGWFEASGLRTPSLYVPPAWALGAVSLEMVAATGFAFVETLTGIYETSTRTFHCLPLVGFQAFSTFEAAVLRASNRINEAIADATGVPLRVAIHPYDLSLLCAGELEAMVEHGRMSLVLEDYLRQPESTRGAYPG
jgi:predicted deacetylase